MKYLYRILLVAMPLTANAARPTSFPMAPGLYEGKGGVVVEVSPTTYGSIFRIVLEKPHHEEPETDAFLPPLETFDRVGFLYAPDPGVAFFVQSRIGERADREFFGGVASRLRGFEISSARVVDQMLEHGVTHGLLGLEGGESADTMTNRLAGALAGRNPDPAVKVDPADPKIAFVREWVHGRVVRFLNGDVTLTFEHTPWPAGTDARFQTDRHEKLVLRLNLDTHQVRSITFERDEASITCRDLLLLPAPTPAES